MYILLLKRVTLYGETSGRGWNRRRRWKLGGWKISRVESFDRVKDDGKEEFGLEDGTGCTPRGHVFTGQRRVKASIKTSMVHRERAWYSWQAPFYRVEAPFRWVGSEGWLLVELNVAHEGGWEKCTRLGGADFARVALKTRDKRGEEEGEGAAVFRRITLDRVR